MKRLKLFTLPNKPLVKKGKKASPARFLSSCLLPPAFCLLTLAIASVCFTLILGLNTTTMAIATPSEPIVFPSSAEIDAKTQVLFEQLFEGFGTVNILIIFLLTLGPLKLIGTFAKLTMNAEPALRRQLALRSFGISTLVILGVALLSQRVLRSWQIDVSAMLMTTGIVLFLVALRTVLAQYNPPTTNNTAPVNPSLELTLNPLVFPSILTPYGIGIVVTLSAIFGRMAIAPYTLFLLLLLVMVLNLGAMLAARPLLYLIKPITLRILGFVFGVMQVALGLDMILTGLKIEAIALKFLVG
ncbi:MAG: MarC family protein [Symploca sp. SIO2E6]|nr:MarC family protein [Symploca sp. SIO2E6]